MITIKKSNINSPIAAYLIQELNDALEKITGSSGKASFSIDDMQSERAVFLIAYQDDMPMGCGALRPLTADTAEFKRIYARPNHSGIGNLILNSLENAARALDYKKVVLETRKVNEKATHFYLKHHYIIRNNYGHYIGHPEAVCFTKDLLA